MKEKRFKIGDKVTYKSKKDCVDYYGDKGYYYEDGEDQDGYVGQITHYFDYNEDMDCWKIHVRTRYGFSYSMLESEFLEYDKSVTNQLFPIY